MVDKYTDSSMTGLLESRGQGFNAGESANGFLKRFPVKYIAGFPAWYSASGFLHVYIVAKLK